MRHDFHKVEMWATKRVKCEVCGNRLVRSKTFYQTLNPWNRNPDGIPKSRSDIWRELAVTVELWKAEPVYCADCESLPPDQREGEG